MRYIPDYNGTARLLRESRELADIVHDAAERGAEYLREIAHVDTGEYRNSVHVEDGHDLFVGDRVASFVVADVPHAAAQDFPHGRGGRSRPGGGRPLAKTIGFIEGEGGG